MYVYNNITTTTNNNNIDNNYNDDDNDNICVDEVCLQFEQEQLKTLGDGVEKARGNIIINNITMTSNIISIGLLSLVDLMSLLLSLLLLVVVVYSYY